MVIGVRVDTAFFQKVASLPGPLTLRIGTTEFNVEPEHLKRLSELADALIAK
jgi:hypothetical protein